MKNYAIRITDNFSSGEMVCTAKNKTEARAIARQYIRQWKLRGATIEYIKEIA
jgi:hypothetical protein